jgi:hypothetical protein
MQARWIDGRSPLLLLLLLLQLQPCNDGFELPLSIESCVCMVGSF